MTASNSMLSDVAEYFSGKLIEHGQSARGVDWNGEESQFNRFSQISRIIREDGFSINDVGCGYGALIDHLSKSYSDFSYFGNDISAPMIQAGNARYVGQANRNFLVGEKPLGIADYSVASGIFNARLKFSDDDWQRYIEQTVDVLHETSSKGFSFNCLTTYSDAEKMRPDLYYSDPCYWFDRCKKRYSRQVALLHDYGLYEFTILVRKA